MGRVRHEGLIKRMIDADRTPAELAEELGLSLGDLALWASEPGNLAALESLARLADIRAQFVVSNYRANAAAQLIQIGTSPDQGDLARKACVDLLKTDLSAFDPPQSCEPDSNAAGPAIDEQSILATLEKIGQQWLNDVSGESVGS